MWPALKPLFTAKEIPIEASALCRLTPVLCGHVVNLPVGIPAAHAALQVVILFLKELDLLVGLAPATETQATNARPNPSPVGDFPSFDASKKLGALQTCNGCQILNQKVLHDHHDS